jgi:hypothetical protein
MKWQANDKEGDRPSSLVEIETSPPRLHGNRKQTTTRGTAPPHCVSDAFLQLDMKMKKRKAHRVHPLLVLSGAYLQMALTIGEAMASW